MDGQYESAGRSLHDQLHRRWVLHISSAGVRFFCASPRSNLTVIRELNTLARTIDVARKECGVRLFTNLMRMIRMPSTPRGPAFTQKLPANETAHIMSCFRWIAASVTGWRGNFDPELLGLGMTRQGLLSQLMLSRNRARQYSAEICIEEFLPFFKLPSASRKFVTIVTSETLLQVFRECGFNRTNTLFLTVQT